MYYVYCHIIIIKANCVGGSKCCALLLYAVKLTKVSAILISPSIAWLLLRCELCYRSYIQSNVYVCTNRLDGCYECFWLC